MGKSAHRFVVCWLVWALPLLSCGPSVRPPEPRDPSRARAGARAGDVLPEIRAAVAAWAKALQSAKKPTDIVAVLRHHQGRPVSFPLDLQCKFTTDAFTVVMNPDPGLPSFFVHVYAAPAEAPPKVRKKYPAPARTCLVRVRRIRGRLGVSARPVKLEDPSAEIDKVAFVRRGRCHLLRLTLTKSAEASADNQQRSSKSKSVRLWSLAAGGDLALGRYELSSEEREEDAHTTSLTSGTMTWRTLGGLQLLVYKASHVEVVTRPTFSRTARLDHTVEKLDRSCSLEQLTGAELQRLRKLPAGKDLPSQQLEGVPEPGSKDEGSGEDGAPDPR